MVREISDGVQGGRLVWSERISCRDCSHLALACGEGDLPSSLRAELLARYGTATVHLDPAKAGPLRVRLLRVLRASGDRSVAAVNAEYDRLTGAGVAGTTGEMRLLADQLTAAGASVCLDLPTHQERLAYDIDSPEGPAERSAAPTTVRDEGGSPAHTNAACAQCRQAVDVRRQYPDGDGRAGSWS